MPANRIFTQLGQPSVAKPAGPLVECGTVPTMIIPAADPAQLAAWQYIYRMAEERARRALEPPRHHQRLFSVWN